MLVSNLVIFLNHVVFSYIFVHDFHAPTSIYISLRVLIKIGDVYIFSKGIGFNGLGVEPIFLVSG